MKERSYRDSKRGRLTVSPDLLRCTLKLTDDTRDSKFSPSYKTFFSRILNFYRINLYILSLFFKLINIDKLQFVHMSKSLELPP